jgi:DNA processing protein
MAAPLIEARELHRGEPGYPVRLAEVHADAAPDSVWVRGELPTGRMVAVVGARAASAGALVAARAVSAGLAARGVAVVSGGAIGVDGAAHRGALDAGGATVVVLGTGIDLVYPTRHASLFQEVVARGGALLTQFPPGLPGYRPNFPARNKVIAALADTLVVIEAGEKSGSLSTAAAAKALGRRLIVLRGSAGCDRLASAGAEAVASAEAAIALLFGEAVPSAEPGVSSRASLANAGGERSVAEPAPGAPPLPTDPRALKLYEALDGTPRDLGEVAARAGVTATEALALAIDLELGGLAARAAGGRYLRLNRGL